MAIRVNHDPSAAVVVPAAYNAGLGQYRQKQSEISRDQYNRDRAAAMQANEQQQRMQLAQQQQAAQQDQMYLQAATRNQENQQQAAFAQQQLGQRQQQAEQANAVDMQKTVQTGLKDGTLRYTAAQKQQVNKLYGDWDKINQAKNLNPRDRALAQQELQRQLQTIQPRPVTEDEKPRSFEDTLKEAVVFANGQDPKDGQWIRDKEGNPKWYPPRNTGAGAKKPEVGQPGQPFYLPNDNPLGETPGESYGVWGPDGKLVPNPNHPWNKKADTADKKPDPAKDFDAMLAHAKDLYKQNQESGMSWDDAKEQAKADFEERRSTASSQDEFNAAAPPVSQETAWNRKRAIRQQYTELQNRAVANVDSRPGTQKEKDLAYAEIERVLPSPRTASPEQMEAAVRKYGPQQPGPPQQRPAQQPPATFEQRKAELERWQDDRIKKYHADRKQLGIDEARDAMFAADKGSKQFHALRQDWIEKDAKAQSLEAELDREIDAMESRLVPEWRPPQGTDQIATAPQQPAGTPPQQQSRPTESLQAGMTVLRDTMNRGGYKPQNEADIVKHYTTSGDTVPQEAVVSLSRYFKQKYGNNIESITPEDAQLMTILAAAAKQADAEAKRNSPQKTTKLP